MKTKFLLITLIVCAGNLLSAQTKANLTIELVRGFAYSQSVPMGLGQTEITPHIAIWLETPKGDYLGTIFVSLKDGKQDFWVGNRPHPLPAWEKASKGKPLFDAIASASPAPKAPQALVFKRQVTDENKEYLIKVEVNMAFDYNNDYKKELYDPWGQPSVIYATTLNPSIKEAKNIEAPSFLVLPETKLTVNKLSGIGSAANILKSIKLSWN